MQSEYGWTDEQIGELPLVRFRQITAAIQQRRLIETRQENSRFSWLARTLAGFTAAGYMVEKGKENKGLKLAQELSYDDIEAELLGAESAKKKKAPEEQNGVGSYERFMAMMGQLETRGKMI